MSPSMHIFEIVGLVKEYKGRRVIDIAQLAFEAGGVYCLYGPNGSGKTTLFELLSLLTQPTGGVIKYKNLEVFPKPVGLRALRATVTMVHQNPVLFDTTVEKNVDYGLRIRRVGRDARRRRVCESLAVVGLENMQQRKARELSGGEAQRVAIARALCISPEVMLLDEFSANIDYANRKQLENIIKHINLQYKTTILFTTHYAEQAYCLSNQVIHLHNGRVVTPNIRNVFRGTIRSDDGLGLFENGKISLYLASPVRGQATITIPCNAVTISKEPLISSMRNCIAGRVVQIIDEDGQVLLRIAAGELMEALISKAAFRQLGLEPGSDVRLNVKASAIEVLCAAPRSSLPELPFLLGNEGKALLDDFFIAALGRRIEASTFDLRGQTFLINNSICKIVGVLISMAIADVFHELCRGIAQMEGHGQRSGCLDCPPHRSIGAIERIAFWSGGKIDDGLRNGKIALRQANKGKGIPRIKGNPQGAGISIANGLARKPYEAADDVERVLAGFKHADQPIE